MRVLLAILLLAFISLVSAAEETVQVCKYGTFEQMLKDKHCNCTKKRPSNLDDVPKAVEYVGVCNLQFFQIPDGIKEMWGTFYYKTNSVIYGVIMYTPSNEEISISFEENKQSRLGGKSFRFEESEADVLKLKIPSKSRDVCAKATIRVRKYSEIINGGSDNEGSYLDGYDVIKVGNYKECK